MISYNQGEPDTTGVYACRVPDDKLPGLFKDVFLRWYQEEWGYLGSDQKYRGSVAGWIGPLQRKM